MVHTIKRILSGRVAKNAGWLIGGKIAQMLINLLVGMLTARYLGPSNYGILNYATAYTTFFISLCDLGINGVLVKDMIDYPGEDGEVLGSSIFMKMISSCLSAIAILGIVCIVDYNEPETILVVALCAIGMIFKLFEVFNYWFQAQLRSKVTALVSLVAYVITAAYKVLLLVMGADVVWFALATSVDYICIAVFLYGCYRKCGGAKLKVVWSTCKRILSKSCYFILPGLMVAVYGQTDKLMLKQMISDEEIGFYATATAVCGMWCFVLSAIIDSLYPSIMESHSAGDEAGFERKNKLLYAIVFYVSMVVSMGFVLLAKPVILILYGEAYLPAVNPLRIITWYTAFSYLGVARNAWIVAKDRQKYLIWIYLSAAVVNVLLNLALIPLWGASGAALASLAAQVLTTMVVPFFIKPLRRNSMMMVEAILLKGIKPVGNRTKSS